MHRYSKVFARIAPPLAAALLALGCADSLSPERRAPRAPDFSQVGALPFTATFDAGADGFSYLDDPFRGTAAPGYASGDFSASGGFSGGGLQVLLGGIDDAGVLGMSGGWSADFTLAAPGNVTIALRYQLTQSSEYESDEYSEALVSVDGVLRGVGGTDRLARLTGDGNGGSPQTTGWQQVEVSIPGLAAGTHTVVIGAYNNKKTASNETTELLIDDVAITDPPPGFGDLSVTTATTGDGIPAGYTLTVTGPSFPTEDSATIGASATESATVGAGDYTVGLSDVPSNCTVSTAAGPNPRTVTVPGGGTGSTTFSVTCTAPNQPPVANFTANCNGLTCSFTSTSSDPDGSIVAYSWTFGDGGTSTAQNPSHTYAAGGTYTVKLTVTDNRGATASASKSVTVSQPNQAPTVNAGSDQTVLLGVLYSLSASFSDPDNGPWSYTINWGDGSSSSGSKSSTGTISASHNYILIGSYTIRVTVTDSRGASGSNTKALTVLTDLPGLPGLPGL